MVLISEVSWSKDFGRLHNIFEIKEEKFTEMMQRKIRLMDMEKFEFELKDKVKQRALEPEKVRGIDRCLEDRVKEIDVEFTLERDAYLPDGKILYKKGTKVNPLDYLAFDRKLYFIDGNEDLEWLGRQELGERDMVILVSGKPMEIQKKLDRKIYFDQYGEMSRRFRIDKIPAIVEQRGQRLIVREVKNVR